MNKIVRNAGAHWEGDLKNGDGALSTESAVLMNQPYDFQTRFGDQAGTNPEELIAAAHAGCYSMAFASLLKKKGYAPQSLNTAAECTLTPVNGGYEISHMRLKVHGQVPGMDEATFERLAQEADENCPVSNLLRPGLEIELEADLG